MKNYEKVFLDYAQLLIRKYEAATNIRRKATLLCGTHLRCEDCPLTGKCSCLPFSHLVAWADKEYIDNGGTK